MIKVFLRVLQNFENTCAGVSFFTEIAGRKALTLLKRDPSMDVVL